MVVISTKGEMPTCNRKSSGRAWEMHALQVWQRQQIYKQIEKRSYLCDIPLHASQVGPEVDKGQDDAHAVGICLGKDQI